jgi:hypothetical protein
MIDPWFNQSLFAMVVVLCLLATAVAIASGVHTHTHTREFKVCQPISLNGETNQE